MPFAGVALWGYKIMRVLGVQMAKLTNSHGGQLGASQGWTTGWAVRWLAALARAHRLMRCVAPMPACFPHGKVFRY